MPRGTFELNRVVKAQAIRVLDVVLVGPLMLIGGHELSKADRPITGNLLSFFGMSTMVYNARNFYLVERSKRRRRFNMETRS